MGAVESRSQSPAPLAKLEGCADFNFKAWGPAANCREAIAAHGVACCAPVILVSVTIIAIKSLLSVSVWISRSCHCRQIGSCVF